MGVFWSRILYLGPRDLHFQIISNLGELHISTNFPQTTPVFFYCFLFVLCQAMANRPSSNWSVKLCFCIAVGRCCYIVQCPTTTSTHSRPDHPWEINLRCFFTCVNCRQHWLKTRIWLKKIINTCNQWFSSIFSSTNVGYYTSNVVD